MSKMKELWSKIEESWYDMNDMEFYFSKLKKKKKKVIYKKTIKK